MRLPDPAAFGGSWGCGVGCRSGTLSVAVVKRAGNVAPRSRCRLWQVWSVQPLSEGEEAVAAAAFHDVQASSLRAPGRRYEAEDPLGVGVQEGLGRLVVESASFQALQAVPSRPRRMVGAEEDLAPAVAT